MLNVGMFFSFRCVGGCNTGVLLDMEKAGDRTTGTYLSFTDGDLGGSHVTLDSDGKIVDREEPPAPAGRGNRPAAANGTPVRAVPMPDTYPPVPGVDMPSGALVASLNPDGWNTVELHLFRGSINVLLNGATLATGLPRNGGPAGREGGLAIGDRIGAQPESKIFGPLALRIGGNPRFPNADPGVLSTLMVWVSAISITTAVKIS
jgi:hypothetical protein